MQKETPKKGIVIEHPQPYFVQLSAQWNPATELKVEKVDNPLPEGTLGDIGLAASVVGSLEFPSTILIQPFDPSGLAGIEPTSVRVFRWGSTTHLLRPVWNSGINVGLGFVWTRIRKPGVYVPIGLPSDRLLQEVLRTMAYQRHYADPDSPDDMKAITDSALALFIEPAYKDLEESRRLLTVVEVQIALAPFAKHDIRRGRGGYLQSFSLPRDASLEEFRERLAKLETPLGGLPEEALFYRPEDLKEQESHTTLPPHSPVSELIDQRVLDMLPVQDRILHPRHHPSPFCRFFSHDWWMYHHDARHTGHASGCSGITSTNVGTMSLRSTIPLDGPVITIPSIVQGKIYVGTSDINSPGGGKTFYKIDLASGTVEHTFTTPVRTPAYAQGIGGSPAIVDRKVYFSTIPGRVYCLDAVTFAQVWVTDLRNADSVHNQPVQNDNADCWSSPLVVNGKVYVGCGEGENNAFGFVYCLDANTGNVLWLFCTNLFPGATDNSPNVIPKSAAGVTPLLAGFAQQADPPQRGASIWSSCAYDSDFNRIYVGTGNAAEGPVPDAKYGSGVLALDANTGVFEGFFQPSSSDSYKPTDSDIDVSASPLLFTRNDGTRVLALGSKSGAFFLLDPATMSPLARRQLLPYDGKGNPLPNVDTYPDGFPENMFGVFGTAAVHNGLGRLFVGIGGYGVSGLNGAIDNSTTPFMRALDWNSLVDAWTTAVGVDGVTRYTVPNPPIYSSPGEAGLSSPAVVNDVVFVSTTKPGLYAFDAATGLCLWSAAGLASGYTLGPAIYGNFVVIGTRHTLNIYSL
jgi:outer membrane protein assembly factor BamB